MVRELWHLMFATGHPVRNLLLVAAGVFAVWSAKSAQRDRRMGVGGGPFGDIVASAIVMAGLYLATRVHHASSAPARAAAPPPRPSPAPVVAPHVVSGGGHALIYGWQIVALVAIVAAAVVAVRWLYRRG